MEVPLKLTLKELYTGTTKRLKITRRVYNKQTGKLEPKEVCPFCHPPNWHQDGCSPVNFAAKCNVCSMSRRKSLELPHAASMMVAWHTQDVITINVQPGWKDGTRITFAGKGDELPGQPPQVRPSYTSELYAETNASLTR